MFNKCKTNIFSWFGDPDSVFHNNITISTQFWLIWKSKMKIKMFNGYDLHQRGFGSGLHEIGKFSSTHSAHVATSSKSSFVSKIPENVFFEKFVKTLWLRCKIKSCHLTEKFIIRVENSEKLFFKNSSKHSRQILPFDGKNLVEFTEKKVYFLSKFKTHKVWATKSRSKYICRMYR